MTAPADSELLTLDAAAALLGWTDTHRKHRGAPTNRAAALRDAILAREAETGLRIALRRGGPKRKQLRVTVHALREHLPELFPGVRTRLTDEGAFLQLVRNIDTKIADSHDALDDRITVVEHDNRVTREAVLILGERVDALAGVVTRSVQCKP